MCGLLEMMLPDIDTTFLHRPWGHFGLLVQIDLLDISASVTDKVLQPGQITLRTSSASLFTPLPVGGLDIRYYFLKNRLFVDANGKGMYFFGYGKFISGGGRIGLNFGRHVSAVGGYIHWEATSPSMGQAAAWTSVRHNAVPQLAWSSTSELGNAAQRNGQHPSVRASVSIANRRKRTAHR